MGMYTEILFRAELVRDVPLEVVQALSAMTNYSSQEPDPLPDHPLFECSRWKHVGCGGSVYFPVSESSLKLEEYSAQWNVFFLCNLKNYSGEIDHFFDWIDPYVDAPAGAFLGYSLYEEDNNPIIYHKKSEKNYFLLDKDVINHWRAELNKEPVG